MELVLLLKLLDLLIMELDLLVVELVLLVVAVHSLLNSPNGLILLSKVELQFLNNFRLLLLILTEVLNLVEESQLALYAQDLLGFLDLLG